MKLFNIKLFKNLSVKMQVEQRNVLNILCLKYFRYSENSNNNLEPKRLQMFAVVEKEGTRWQDTGVFTRICVEQPAAVVELYSVVRLPGDSPSNRIQITFPPSPSAEALCGHGTPPYGSTIILYGPLKAAWSRTARPKNVRVIAAIQTIGVNKGERY